MQPVNSSPTSMDTATQPWVVVISMACIVMGYFGLGVPHHYYQPLFATLTLLILYRHHKILRGTGNQQYLLMLTNFLLLCFLYKLLIGGGVNYPFDWLKVPQLVSENAPEGAPWYQLLFPDLKLEMKPVPNVSDWSIDVTKLQTLFLLATLAGAVFRFQPFSSLAAIGLLLISIPTFAAFNWDWVILFLIGFGTSFYLQSPINRT